MPRVVLVFLTIDGTDLKETWDRWYDDWLKYLEGRQAHSDITGYQNKHNPYLKGVVFRNPQAPLETVRQRSPYFASEYIVNDPVAARRWYLLNATRQAFSYALKMHPDATHYSLVSETTIPLKPFKHIWGQLAADPRSKVDLFCLEHREGYPKHSQWLTLTREHAKALVAPHRLWEVGANRLIRGTCPTLCGANDEYWPVRIISENLRISGYDEWERQFEARSMAHPLGTLNWHTFIDWNLYNPRSVQSALGEASGRSWSHPTTFTSVSGRFLRTLVAADNVWFARKMTNDLLPVKSCNESPLMFLGDALRAELRSPKRPQQAPSKMPFDFGPHMDCALVDFLSLLLQAGPWAPVTGHDIPEYLKGYITTQEDRLDLGRGGLFMVRDAQGQQIDHGLDALLAGTLRGSNWTGGPGLEKGITVELRPLFAYELDTLAEAVQRRMVFNEEVPDRSVQEQGAAVEEFEALTTRDEQHWDVDLRSDL